MVNNICLFIIFGDIQEQRNGGMVNNICLFIIFGDIQKQLKRWNGKQYMFIYNLW
jgi:hypothetical protein